MSNEHMRFLLCSLGLAEESAEHITYVTTFFEDFFFQFAPKTEIVFLNEFVSCLKMK